LILVAQAMRMLPTSFSSRQGVEDWFGAHIRWMTTSAQGQEAAQLKNKMSRWYHAAVSLFATLKLADMHASLMSERAVGFVSAYP
jgi:hypothetical protein